MTIPPRARDAATCPCGSGRDEAACCGPILAGAPAPTALALMRSRYTAFVRGAIEHLVETHAPETRGQLDVAGATRWSRESRWLRLEILATEAGGSGDAEGTVEFIARGVTRGEPFAHHERSRFARSDGRWYYVEAVPGVTPARSAPTPGRNDPCPCGSGKKWKRCHG